ncbi:MAG: hypothetical protein WCD16_00285, partial [Paracoccaceae bacterium]
GGLILGAVSGIVTAQMMVKLLTGVFDPPPEALVVPWAYLALVAAIITVSVLIAVLSAAARSERGAVEALRDL